MKIKQGQPINIQFPIFAFEKWLSIIGKVVRCDSKGFAVMFNEAMDVRIFKERRFPGNVNEDNRSTIKIDKNSITTGTGPEDRLCQIAFKPEVGPTVCELFNPGRPISIDAMDVHHITNKMVEDKPPFQGSEAYERLNKLVDDASNIIVGHNAKFDVEMLNREGINPQENTDPRLHR